MTQLTRRSLLVGLFSLVACLIMLVNPVLADAPIRQISIDYKVVATELQHGGIPLRLPKVVVYQLPPDVNRAFYVAKGHLTDDPPGYALTIGHQDCKGANACTIALAEAQQITSSTGSIEDLFPPLDPEMIAAGVEQSPERNGWLQLANGQSVYFSGWVRAASMGYSYLIWDEGNYRYTLGLKGGKRDWLVAMANSIP